MSETESSQVRWQPLEANPEVMSKYATKLGLSSHWEFVDVFSLDLLDMVPRPCCAFILLFPITEKYKKYCEEEKKRISKDPPAISPLLYFMKQTIGNACGTIALVHSIGNNYKKSKMIIDNSPLKLFLDAASELTPEERGRRLESNEDISKAHQSSAHEGQSREISADEKVDLHFVAIVNVDGTIYELDGRKPCPVAHGKCSNEYSFVEDAAKVCKTFMQRDPEETRFSIVALVQKIPKD